MKIVYKQKILDKILDAKFIASDDNKTIDYILLTQEEWQQLKTEVNFVDWHDSDYGLDRDHAVVFGINIKRTYKCDIGYGTEHGPWGTNA